MVTIAASREIDKQIGKSIVRSVEFIELRRQTLAIITRGVASPDY
jgi:hypothetical protein